MFKFDLVFRIIFHTDPNPNAIGFGFGAERSRIRIGLKTRIRIQIRIRKKIVRIPNTGYPKSQLAEEITTWLRYTSKKQLMWYRNF